MKSAGWVACIAVCVSVVFPVNASALLTQFASTRDVAAIAHDNKALWFATSGGLVTIPFKTGVPRVIADVSGMRDIHLVGLSIESESSIWLASRDGYIVRYNPLTERSISYNSLAYADWRINLIQSSGQYLFVGTTKGFSVFSKTTGRVIANSSRFGGLAGVNVYDILVTADTISVLVADGFARLYAPDVRRVNFSDPSVWNTTTVNGAASLTVDQTGAVTSSFSRTFINGAVTVELTDTILTDALSGAVVDTMTFVQINGATELNPGDYVRCVHFYGETLLLGMREQTLYRKQPGSNWERIAFPGPPASDIRQTTVDDSGILWAMMSNTIYGLGRYDGTTWSTITQQSDSTPGFGILNSGATSRFNRVMTASNGDLWIGTSGHGAKRRSAATGTWTSFLDQTALPDIQSIVPGAVIAQSPITRFEYGWWTFVGALSEDSDGNIWIGNEWAYNDSIIHVYDPAGNRWRTLDVATYGFPGTWVRALATTKDRTDSNVVIAGFVENLQVTGFGLSVIRYKGSPFSASFSVRHAIPPLITNDIVVASDTLAWIASSGGLYRMRNANLATLRKIETVRPGTPLYSVALSPRGNPVIALNGDLCEYFDSTRYGDSIANLTKSGLLGTDVYDIYYHASTGVYWISTGKGLFRFASGEYSDPAITSYSSAVVFPNPLSRSRRDTYVMFDRLVPESSVSVYDVTGLLVWRSGPGDTQGSSGQLIRWDGRNNGGALVLPGTYYYRIYAKGVKKSAGKLLVIP